MRAVGSKLLARGLHLRRRQGGRLRRFSGPRVRRQQIVPCPREFGNMAALQVRFFEQGNGVSESSGINVVDGEVSLDIQRIGVMQAESGFSQFEYLRQQGYRPIALLRLPV